MTQDFLSHQTLCKNEEVVGIILDCNNPLTAELLSWLCQAPSITTYRVNLLQTTLEAFKCRVQQLLADRYEYPPTVYGLSEMPEVLCIENMPAASAQLNSNSKEVLVDACCGAALLRGAHIYAPGVLAMETGTRLGEQVQVYADLAGRCKKGTCTRYNSTHKLFLGVGIVHMQRHQLYTAAPPTGIAVTMQVNCSGVPCLGDLSGSEALLQNLPSIVCVRVLDAQPGEHVLDMCAAPGNKTTHIAELMQDCGILVALDKTEKKIAHVRAQLQQNNLKCVCTFAFDATKAYEPSGQQRCAEAEQVFPPFPAATFDRILLDAPCSALGNRPLLASAMTLKMLQSFPHVQRKLFEAAVPLLRAQGVLVYSTCTVTEAENERMVVWALQKFPQLQLVDATPRLGAAGLAVEGLSEEQRQLVQRFGPPCNNANKNIDTVGFFIAKFIKR